MTTAKQVELFKTFLKKNKRLITKYQVFYEGDQEYTKYKSLDNEVYNKIFDQLKQDKTENGDAMTIIAFTDTYMIKFCKRTAPEKFYRYF